MKKYEFKTLNLQNMNKIRGGDTSKTMTLTLGSVRFIKEEQLATNVEVEITVEREVEIYF